MKRVGVFLVLLAFWLVLSGHYDLFHIASGVFSAGLVTALSADLLSLGGRETGLSLWRFFAYLPWLLYQIVLANLHVVYLIAWPREIRPQIVRFRTTLRSELARTTLGNSITLTPGTVTMDIEGDEFVVHALSDKVARDLQSGAMERRVARIFDEGSG